MLLGAGCLLPVASCCDDDSSSESSTASITIQEERSYSYDDSSYQWTSPGPVARVRLEVNDFNHGDMAITIYDALARVIFAKVYWTFDWYWYIDGEYFDIDITSPGEPGPWTILLEYAGFTGDVTLVVETTEDIPSEPVVPPPDVRSDLLDAAYGDAGRAAFATDTTGSRRLVIDPAGRTITCGTSVDTNGQRSLSLWRFDGDGRIDTSFGSDGRFLLAHPELSASAGFDLALDGAGGILVAGWVAGSDRRTDLAVVRVTGAGLLDTGFGVGGIARIDEGADENGPGLARDGTGPIYVAGASRAADNSSGHLFLARLLANGAPDPSFGTAGIVRPALDPTDRGLDVAIQAGQPVVLGSRGEGIVLLRFTQAGELDASFGSNGVVTSAGPAGEVYLGRALTIAGDDSLAVAGVRMFTTEGAHSDALVWRFLPDGSPLTAFNGTGLLAYRYEPGSAAASDVTFDAQGRLLVSGGTKRTDTGEASATLWRWFASGSPDGSLPGSDGTGLTRFDTRPEGAGTSASTVVVTANGSAFATGSAFDRSNGAIDALVWKLRP